MKIVIDKSNLEVQHTRDDFSNFTIMRFFSGQIYRDFFAKVSHSLDQHISNEVARQLMEEFPLETKSDLIVEQAQEGAMSLLRRWPEMKWKLRACFNQPLPGPIRQLAWRLYLENTKLRKIYTKLLSGNARSAISPADQEISQKCDYLLKAEPTFEDLCGSLGKWCVSIDLYLGLEITRNHWLSMLFGIMYE